MKYLLFVFTLATFCSLPVSAQKMTVILVRHAEKDASATMNRMDPVLSPEGKQRALKLLETVKIYKPDRIFSTNLLRTRLTVDPLATNLNASYRMWVEPYDSTDLEAFATLLTGLKAKCVLVAGHSNTTPKLANILIKQDKYKDLPDSEYRKIFIIRINGTKVTDEVIEY